MGDVRTRDERLVAGPSENERPASASSASSMASSSAFSVSTFSAFRLSGRSTVTVATSSSTSS